MTKGVTIDTPMKKERKELVKLEFNLIRGEIEILFISGF